MVIRTRRQVWFFAVTITAIALAAAEMLNFALFPPDILAQTLTGTAVIVVLVTIPICLWVGEKMRENANLSAQLQYLVNRDRLTSVGTRDYFFARMAQTTDATGVMLMLDLDHFKAINDGHGHLVGDEVIKAVAAVLRQQTRQGDLVCRFGGEEFVVYLPETTMNDGFELAERLRANVEDVIVTAGTAQVRATISIGGALKHRAVDLLTVLRQADKALYRAKAQGRNRTIFAATPKITPAQGV